MRWLPAIFALLIAASGWYYLFYSQAAHRLAVVEDAPSNRRRCRLRRLNGFVMLLFSGFFYAGYYSIDEKRSVALFAGVWLMVVILLLLIVLFALLDVRLTARLHRRRR